MPIWHALCIVEESCFPFAILWQSFPSPNKRNLRYKRKFSKDFSISNTISNKKTFGIVKCFLKSTIYESFSTYDNFEIPQLSFVVEAVLSATVDSNGEVDVTSVKNALEEFGRSGGDAGLSESELSLLRWLGAKASMSSIMQHLNIPPKVVRIQGAWRNKEDAMADSYLRAAQILVLEAQERCLSYLRNGGDLPHLTGEPLGGKLPSEGDTSDDKSRVEEAMGAPKHFAAHLDTLPPELLSEKDFDEEKKVKDGVLKPCPWYLVYSFAFGHFILASSN